LPTQAIGERLVPVVLHALLLAGGLLPLAAMLVALFAAAWLRQAETGQGRREELAPARRQ
jgi:hypothetical protein